MPTMKPITMRGAFACLVLVLFCSPGRAQEQLADVIERAERSVVRIEVKSNSGDSLGSGFVVDDQGTLVTNCHVLAGARQATVHFPNGLSGSVLGTFLVDQARDIVVARISITDAPPIEIAQTLPRKGESVTALGAPHGLSFTATTGIVSAIRPAQEMADDLGRDSIQGVWVQVDAAISPGNSGGPLINREGKVVAMSTLASQGSAQNLNFGISAPDIAKAVRDGKRAGQVVSLAAGVGKVRMGESGGPSDGGPNAGRIPSQALKAYIEAGLRDYSDLSRGLRAEGARLSADLKEMRKGANFIPRGNNTNGAAILKVDVPGQRQSRWFFLSQSIKDSALEKQQDRIKAYTKLKNQTRDVDDPGSLSTLLWNYGPPLDVRKNQSVGFLSDLIIVHAFNDHEVLAAYRDKPYLLWMESTTGVSGGELLSGPVFVAGTATVKGDRGIPTAVTVLQQVSKENLQDAVQSHFSEQTAAVQQSPSEGYRMWNDRTGRFSVEALLLSSTDTHVNLKKRDGNVIQVPISALCDADLKYIRQ